MADDGTLPGYLTNSGHVAPLGAKNLIVLQDTMFLVFRQLFKKHNLLTKTLLFV
ncbi:hypothetical protein CCP3SC1AL1_660007 [Gammaproteobacteria bacterium]